jgi:hypothetical protein
LCFHSASSFDERTIVGAERSDGDDGEGLSIAAFFHPFLLSHLQLIHHVFHPEFSSEGKFELRPDQGSKIYPIPQQLEVRRD